MIIPLFLFVISSIWVLLKIDNQELFIEFSSLSSFIILFVLYRHVFFGQWSQVKTPVKILLIIGAVLLPLLASFLNILFYVAIGNEYFEVHGEGVFTAFLLSIWAALFALLYRAVEKWIFRKKSVRFYPQRALLAAAS